MLQDGTPGDPEDAQRNYYPVLYWNWVGLEFNRVSTSLQGRQGGPTLGSRALGLLHLAMHNAWFGCRGLASPKPYVANQAARTAGRHRDLGVGLPALVNSAGDGAGLPCGAGACGRR